VPAKAKDPECQPARFTGIASREADARWDFIGFNSDVAHYFLEVVDIGPELTDGHRRRLTARRPPNGSD
jgi:hypothetical protein